MSKSYEIISETRDGKLVSVCATKANSGSEAREKTANFCAMMGITVHSVIGSKRWAEVVASEDAPDCSAN